MTPHFRRVACCLLCLLVGRFAIADEPKSSAPALNGLRNADGWKGVPLTPTPSILIAQISGSRLTLQGIFFHERRIQTPPPADNVARAPGVQRVDTIRTLQDRAHYFDLSTVKVATVDGKILDQKTIVTRLSKPTAVLTTEGKTAIDPLYLQAIKGDVLIVTLPARPVRSEEIQVFSPKAIDRNSRTATPVPSPRPSPVLRARPVK